mmetsp:Transcript_7073/g.16951  ORF Transcript_7073/g.16951 Transcript_7073/m.16951 type:complete len:209 (-) Transcript_7073:396-1022(-)
MCSTVPLPPLPSRMSMLFHVSSSNGLVPLMTMFGRKRLIGIGSFPLLISRRFSSCKLASQATNIGNPSLSAVLGTPPVQVKAAGGRYRSSSSLYVTPGMIDTTRTSPYSCLAVLSPSCAMTLRTNCAASSPTSTTSTVSSHIPARYRTGHLVSIDGVISTWTDFLFLEPPVVSTDSRIMVLLTPSSNVVGRDALMVARLATCLCVTNR